MKKLSVKQRKAAYLKEAIATVELWRGRMFLQEWNIDVNIEERDKDENPDVLAEINADARYLGAKLTIYPAWTRRPYETRCRALVHELAHCITTELQCAAKSLHNGVTYPPHMVSDINERLTQRVANVAMLGWEKKGQR